MSSVNIPPLPPVPGTTVVAPPTASEIVVERRIAQTQRQVKNVDVAQGLTALAIGVLAYLLAVATVDHWVVEGGLGFWGRLFFWLVLVGAAGVYFVCRLWPPLVRRINPLFAAATIEEAQPTLRNSLINFLLFRGHREDVAPIVYQAMERQAATDLAGVEADVAVDRGRVIRLGYVLVAVLAVFSLYLIISPKNPIRSAMRVLLPWATIDAPTRVTIRDVQPGTTVAFLGDLVAVSAEVAGLRDGEQVVAVYSTEDGQVIDQAVPLTQAEGDYRSQCQLPPDKSGLQQSIRYHLAGGDCRTKEYRIEAQIAPAMIVDKVSYHYPAYTGLNDQTLERQGDLRAIEGTEATISATANTEIKSYSAEIDLGCAGHHGRRMTIDGKKAVGTFTMRLNPKDPSVAEYDSYQLRFADVQGRENARPIRHGIEVIRDLPPDLQVLEPQAEETQVALNGRLNVKVHAVDPDFALRRVAVRAQVGQKELTVPPLLDLKKPEKARHGDFTASHTFEPARLGLKVGDRVEYWAEAEDNKEPTANLVASAKQAFVVVAPERNAPKDADKDKAASERPADQKAADKPDGKNSESQEQTKGQSADKQTPQDAKSDQPKSEPSKSEQAKSEQSKSDQSKAAESKSEQSQQQSKSEQTKSEQQSGSSESGQSQEKSDSGQSQQQQGESQKSGEKGSADQQGSQQNGSPSNQRIDPDAAPGDAMQEILNDRQQQKQQQQKSGSPQSADQQQSSQEKQPGNESKQDQQQSGSQQGTEQPKPSSDKQQADKRQSGDQSTESKAEKQPGGEKPDGNQKRAGSEKSGKQPQSAQQGRQDEKQDQSNSKQKGGQQDAGQQGPGEKGEKNAAEKSDKRQGNPEKGTGEKSGKEQGEDQSSGGDKGKSQADGEKSKDKGSAGDKQDKQQPGSERSGSPTGGDERQESADQRKADQQKPGQQQPKSGDDQKSEEMSGGSERKDDKQGGQDSLKPAQKASGKQEGDQAPSASMAKEPSDAKDGATDRSADKSESKEPNAGQSGKEDANGQSASTTKEAGKGKSGTQSAETKAEGQPTGEQTDAGVKGDQQSQKTAKGDDRAGKNGNAQENQASRSSDGKATGQSSASGSQKSSSGDVKPGGARGQPAGGVADGKAEGATTPPETSDNAADEANLEYTRRQTQLALEYLRDQLAKEKPKLLERLGWSKDDARRFIERWEAMQRAAAEKGPTGEAARKHLDDALRSLGLRSGKVELRRGRTTIDKPQDLRDSGRFAPPPGWEEQFREYTRGVAGGQGNEK